MQRLFTLLPILVVISIIVAWCFPLLALGVRFDLWSFKIALPLLAGAALSAAILLALAGVSLLGSIRQQLESARHRAILVILILIVPVATVFHYGLKASQAPVLYDVSTDWENPPTLLSAVRPSDANPLQTAAEVKALQQQFYPDVKTLSLSADRGGLLGKIQTTAESMDWAIIAVDAEQGVVQATAKTFWFGFVDDIVIRVKDSDGEQALVQVDVRSTSRVGKSDLGKNAERVKALLLQLQ